MSGNGEMGNVQLYLSFQLFTVTYNLLARLREMAAHGTHATTLALYFRERLCNFVLLPAMKVAWQCRVFKVTVMLPENYE